MKNYIQSDYREFINKGGHYDYVIIDSLNSKGYNGCYVFSGNSVDDLDIDCVDIIDYENKF